MPLVALLIACLLSVSACGFAAAARTPGVLEQAIEHDPPTLDPALWSDVVSGRLIGLICSPLMRADEQMHPTGDLAESWELDASGTLYTFHLNPRARFTTGRRVTSQDVKYSFERVMSPATKALRTWVLEPILGAAERLQGKAQTIRGITAVDPLTVRIELQRPHASFLQLLTLPITGIVPREEVERLGPEFARKPTGSGPFSVVSWDAGGSVVLKANPACHLGAPRLTGMRYRVIKEPLTRSTEFQLGNLDVIAVPPSDLGFYAQHPAWRDRIQRRSGLNVYYLGLNCEKTPTSDVRVRRAIAMAIQRDSILASVRKGLGVAAHGPIPPEIPGYDASYSGVRYDPEGARRLLKEAGYGSGLDLELTQGDSRDNLEVTAILASYLARVGIRVRIAPFEWQTFMSRVKNGSTQAYFLSWWGEYADAENFLEPLFHSSQAGTGGNHPRYRSPQADALLERLRLVSEPRARGALASQIERLCVEDASRVFLYHKLDILVTQPWVTGVRLYPVYSSNRFLEAALDGR